MMAALIDTSSPAGKGNTSRMDRKSDSLRSVLSYYESNIAANHDEGSKSFISNIAGSPHKQLSKRRLSMDSYASQQPSSPGNDKPKIQSSPTRMSRRASWCSGVDTETKARPRETPILKSPKAPVTISKGTVGKTKAFFEGMASQCEDGSAKPRMSRRSSVGPGVEVLRRQESFVNADRFQQMREFWSTLPKPDADSVAPRYPRRWNSRQPIPQTVRDIALKAATPKCLCEDDDMDLCSSSVASVCLSCGLDTTSEGDADDSSVRSSAVCVYDGSNLYLPLPQGCMVFRSAPGFGLPPLDHVPQRPSRHGSMRHGPPSTRSLSSVASFTSFTSNSSVITASPPRRVRFSEEDEVWFFEVDDLSSVFSEDGLELAQDFGSIFDGGNDHGPRQVRRRGSASGASVSSPIVNESITVPASDT